MSTNIRNLSNEFSNERECLRSMAEEIREGIFNFSSGEFDKTALENDVQTIIERSANEKYSEAVVNLLLFRKYADVANVIKSEKQNQTKASFDLTAFDPSALVLHDINEDKLVGTLAFGEKIFWLRVFASVLAFVAMVVMVSIPGIAKFEMCPARNFESGCIYYEESWNGQQEACFNQRAYLFIIVTAAILIPHNLFFAWYYLLPITENGKKMVPGLCILLRFPSYIAPLFDIMLLILSFLGAIQGSLALQTVAEVKLYNGSRYHGVAKEGYYTIASFYAEFANTEPYACVKASDDPSPRMNASITMMYFAACLMGLCCAASFNHCWKQYVEPLKNEEKNTVETSSESQQLMSVVAPHSLMSNIEDQDETSFVSCYV